MGLDLLRCVAVCLVLFRHLEIPHQASGLVSAAARAIQRGGWIGVDIFFVLSGFLVSGLLFAEFKRTGTLSVGRFLLRRGFKIYPAFWVMIGATALVRCWTHDELGLPFNLMGELLFIQNYAGNIGNLWGHTWSLAVEEHFYFLLAALCWLLVTKSKAGIRSLPVVFAVIAIGCLALRVSAATQLSPSSWIGANQLPPDVCFTVLFPTHLRLDSLMCGVAVAYWWHFCMSAQQIKAASRWWIACVVVGMAFCLPAFVWDLSECLWVPVLGVVAFYIGAAFIMIGLHVAPGLPATKFAVATAWLGTHSYSVYLWHRPTQAWGARLMEAWLGHRPSWVVLGLVYLVASWMVGVTLAKLIETPALRLRDALMKKSDPVQRHLKSSPVRLAPNETDLPTRIKPGEVASLSGARAATPN